MKTIAQRLKFTATTLAASCLTLGMAGNAVADSSLDTIMERGEIRIGVYDGFKPWAFRSPDGDIEGITIDIAKSIAETLDVDLKLVVVNSTNRTQFLRQKRIDVVMAGLYDSLQHRKNADSILPSYWASGPSLMAKKGVISSWDDIRDKPVCVKQAMPYAPRVQKEFGAKIVSFSDNTTSKEGLRTGKCVAWVYDDAGILEALASGSWDDYEMPVDALYTNPWSAYVRKGDGDTALGTLLTGQFYKLHSSGKLLELAEKWGAPVTAFLDETHKQLEWDSSYLDD
ncbi:MAG TPA: transporter substrate-binding domain-containing protein [Burkholderiaceae bacterium]|nr:transporter substrate-binding domain-containing protein [Burkholderiaceae bacterium]